MDYWFVTFTDAPPGFYRNENSVTEEEWRRDAPTSEVEKLDAAFQGLFPKDVAAS